MSRYLNLVGNLSRTDGNDLLAYLALTVAAAALPGAALFFLVLAALALLLRVLLAGRDRLAALLHSGRFVLAVRLRQVAAVIGPRPTAEPNLLPAIETTIAPESLPQAEPVPCLMASAAQVTFEAPAHADDERERLAATLAEHGSIRAAARVLGLGESTLRGRLKRHGIEAPTSKRSRKAQAALAA
jgi:Bacterial regulatory protein, Fis family